MEADALQDTMGSLIATLRLTLRTELTSIWLPIQFGAIALAAFAAWGAAAAIRKRFDLVSATMGWPSYLRIAVRALIDNFGVLAFMLILGVIRTAIRSWVDASAHLHPRRGGRPRHRLGGDRAGGKPDPQPFRQPHRRGDGLDHRCAQHSRPARRHRGRARFPRHPDRRHPRHAAARPQDLGAACGGVVGRDRDQQLP